MFMIFCFSDVSMTPKTIMFDFGDTKRLQLIQERSQIIFKTMFGNLKCWYDGDFEFVGTARGGGPADPPNIF